MKKLLKCEAINCQHCSTYSKEDTRLKTTPIRSVDYVEMGCQSENHPKGGKRHQKNLLACFSTCTTSLGACATTTIQSGVLILVELVSYDCFCGGLIWCACASVCRHCHGRSHCSSILVEFLYFGRRFLYFGTDMLYFGTDMLYFGTDTR
jgi:hypothetical protein